MKNLKFKIYNFFGSCRSIAPQPFHQVATPGPLPWGSPSRATPKSKKDNYQSGQALILLLFFMMIGITITTAAVAIIGSNSLAANDVQQGEIAKGIAETGAERAILEILRNGEGYTGETLTNTLNPDWDSGWNAVIVVSYDSGTGTFTIDSTGSADNYIKNIRVTASYNGNQELIVNTWKEI